VSDPAIVSVSEANELVRAVLENEPVLSNLWIDGEVTSVYLSPAKHLYFTLSDGAAKLKVVAFRNSALRMIHAIELGAQVTVNGRISVYVPNGEYQLIAEFAAAAGQGLAALEYGRLRARLEAEGLFDPMRRRPLPAYPRVIGVVTSLGGAVIHDIQTVFKRRFPFAQLLISPCQVQGVGSITSVRRALDLLIEDGRSDVIIIARGGGSAEDLATFNDEGLARQIFACPIPVISAIGHETDFSLSDDVADLRAPTPSAAAELATPDIADLALSVLEQRERLRYRIELTIQEDWTRLDALGQRLDRAAPHAQLLRNRALLVELRSRLERGLRDCLQRESASVAIQHARLNGLGLRSFDRLRSHVAGLSLIGGQLVLMKLRVSNAGFALARSDLENVWQESQRTRIQSVGSLSARLDDLNPGAVLKRGFAVLVTPDGKSIASVHQIAQRDPFRAVLGDGTIDATVVRTVPT